MIVYKIVNIVNSKVYVGITTHSLKRRAWQHFSSAERSGTSILSKAIEKYGKQNFKFEQIDMAKNECELIKKEKYWIKRLNTLSPNGYNVLFGQVSGSSLARSRMVPVTCLETGKVFESITDAAKEYGVPIHSVWCACSGRTDFAGQFSFRYIDSKKLNKSENKRRNRLAKSKVGYAEGAKKKKRSVKCLNTGEVFDSIKSAAMKFNIDPSQLVRVCKGKNGTVKGLRFSYLE